MKAFKQFVSDIDSWTGVALGLIAIGIAIVIRPWTQYRFINDPLQLIQPILNLRFGFLFFAWGQILNHLLFIISISSIALLYANLQRRPSADVALKVVTIALLIAFAHIFWLKVDAVLLIMWYGIAAWVSLMVARWLTQLAARLLF